MTPAVRWGAALTRVMVKRRMRAVDLAQLTGAPQPTVANWLHGRSLPVPTSAESVADALMEPDLLDLCLRLRRGTCGVCERVYIDAGRHLRKRWCSTRCWNAARWRRVKEGQPERRAIVGKRLALYMEAVDRTCRVWCSPDGLCPDATCPIQAAQLSPLPLAKDARRVA